MKDLLISLFLIAHGWAHVWYVALSQRLVEYKPEMGWTGESWILSSILNKQLTQLVSTFGYSVSLIGFIIGGVSLYLGKDWWSSIVLASSIISLLTVILYWDGELSMIVEKGLIGIIINVALIVLITRLT